jgi:hypothetical protein
VGPRQYGRRKAGRRAVRPRRPRQSRWVDHTGQHPGVGVVSGHRLAHGRDRVTGIRGSDDIRSCHPDRTTPPVQRAGGGSGWSSAWLLGPVGCGGRPPCTPGLSTWSSSRSLRTICAGNLVLEGASRLDAFSAYPVPTWLPGDAPSGTAGTPEVGPPQSSRTRGDAPQVSYAHGR